MKEREWEELIEDAQVISAEEMQRVDSWLQSTSVPAPSAAGKQRLLAHLTASMEKRESFYAQMQSRRRALGSMGSLLAVLRPQIGLMRPTFWLASCMLVLFGALFSLGVSTTQPLPLLIAAPFLAGVGMSYAFRAGAGMRDLEDSAIFGRFESSWGRVLLVLGYDVILLLPASLILHWSGMGASLPFLVLSWLAPLLLVGAIGLYLALRYDSLVGMLGATGIWVALLAIGMWEPRFSLASVQPVAGGWEYRLLLLALGAFTLLFVLRWVRRLDDFPTAAAWE